MQERRIKLKANEKTKIPKGAIVKDLEYFEDGAIIVMDVPEDEEIKKEKILELSELQKKKFKETSDVFYDLFGARFEEAEEAFDVLYSESKKSKKTRRFFNEYVLNSSLKFEICWTSYQMFKKTKDFAKSMLYGLKEWEQLGELKDE